MADTENTPMTMDEAIREENLAHDKILYIPSLTARYWKTDECEDLIDALSEGQVVGAPDCLSNDEDWDWSDTYIGDAIGDVLLDENQNKGFAVCYALPVRTYIAGREDQYGYSWGHYAVSWFWADTLEAAHAMALVWKDEMVAKWKAQVAA